MKQTLPMPTPTTAKPNSGTVATCALAAAQLVSWGAIYYAFSLFVVPMESVMGWSRTATNAALPVGLLVSGLAAYPVGTWIDHGHGRRVMVCGSLLAAAMLALWSQAESIVTLFVVWVGLGAAMAATLYDPVFALVTRDYPDGFRTKITLTSPEMLILFAIIYGGADGMMTILRGTVVQGVMWTEGYGAVSGLLSMPSNIAKGIAPISAAAIWASGRSYFPVEWTVLLVSLVSAVAFILAMRFSSENYISEHHVNFE
jgi:hypothetical protein